LHFIKASSIDILGLWFYGDILKARQQLTAKIISECSNATPEKKNLLNKVANNLSGGYL
jgi:hypothetical protein